MRIALLGHMGRDEAVADRLAKEDHQLYVVGQWENPGLVNKAHASGGRFEAIGDVTDVEQVAYCVERIQPDMFLTNLDNALAVGVVDTLKKHITEGRLRELYIPSPDRYAARIEWDKFYLRELIDEIAPSYNPINFMAQTKDDIYVAIEYFKNQDTEIAIKPRGLTGGKGVKVMGKHFDTFSEGEAYALQCLVGDKQLGVEIQEKIKGHEFTMQLFTDGKTLIKPPVTYDYPYREDGDSGPGTGGMGAFSMKDGLLPFITRVDYDEAFELMKQLLIALQQQGQNYKGVLYPTFFKTTSGLKIVETNARGGDPELINIVDLMEDDVNLGEVLQSIATGELAQDQIRYKKSASAMLYLVSPDYGYRKGQTYDFTMDINKVEALDCKVRFAAAERVDRNGYRTVGSSRSVGISALGKTAWEAREKILLAIRAGFGQPLSLCYRSEIADRAYIKSLGNST